jgi:hypothetical protein
MEPGRAGGERRDGWGGLALLKKIWPPEMAM